jgi:hypothetical protein
MKFLEAREPQFRLSAPFLRGTPSCGWFWVAQRLTVAIIPLFPASLSR